jgi:hypothetical protein
LAIPGDQKNKIKRKFEKGDLDLAVYFWTGAGGGMAGAGGPQLLKTAGAEHRNAPGSSADHTNKRKVKWASLNPRFSLIWLLAATNSQSSMCCVRCVNIFLLFVDTCATYTSLYL